MKALTLIAVGWAACSLTLLAVLIIRSTGEAIRCLEDPLNALGHYPTPTPDPEWVDDLYTYLDKANQ